MDLCGLKDNGDHFLETLCCDPLSAEQVAAFKDLTRQLSEAVASGMQIQHKQDIIVHMPLDDNVTDEES